MNKSSKKPSGIVIDESTHQPVPTLFDRLKNALFAGMLSGAVAVLVFFALTGRLVALSWTNPIVMIPLGIGAIAGFVTGKPFVNMLFLKVSDEFSHHWK